MNYYEKHKQTLQNILIMFAIILGSILFFRYFFTIVLPFLCGWLLSLLFLPIVNRLAKAHVPRGLGSLFCIILLLTIIGLFSFLIGTKLTAQIRLWYDSLPLYLEQSIVLVEQFWLHIDALTADLPLFVHDFIMHVRTESSSMILTVIQSMGSFSAIAAVPKFLLGFVIALFSSYFFTKDAHRIQKVYEKTVVQLLGESLEATKSELRTSLWGYIKTQLILMCIVFIVSWIGLSVLRSPYALLLSLLIAVIDAFPFFGSGFILWPGAVIHLVFGNTHLAIGYLVIYALLQLLRQLMQPKILGEQIGLHPLLTLFSMYFGFRTLGAFGLIIGPIIAVVLKGLLILRSKSHTE